MVLSLDVSDPVKTVIVPYLKQWGMDLSPAYVCNYFEVYREDFREVIVDWSSKTMTDHRVKRAPKGGKLV
jgi:hypothetical protein